MTAPASLARLAELTRHQCDRAAARLAEARQAQAQAEAQLQRVAHFVGEYGGGAPGHTAWQLNNRAAFRLRLDQALAQQQSRVAEARQRVADARRSWEAAHRASRSLEQAAEQQRLQTVSAQVRQQRRHEETRCNLPPWQPAWTG